MKFAKFLGINNILPSERLGDAELATAINVDVGLSGELSRRAGLTTFSSDYGADCLWERPDGVLGRVGGFLFSLDQSGAFKAILVSNPSLSSGRVWFCNLPDGRTTYSNGTINGVTDGATTTKWGVPIPASIGTATPVAGAMDPGSYQYQVTYVRLSDGLEGGPAYSNPIPLPDGGLLLTGLPTLAGHKINVYITGANGDKAYLAGSTTTATFSYLGKTSSLVLPCWTDFLSPPPVGTITTFWRGRVLLAVGPVMYASRTNQWELFDLRQDFKQFTAPITMIQPVDDGIWVGTEKELAFLAGTEFDKLVFTPRDVGPVTLGSGVSAPGEKIKLGDGTGQGAAMVCIAGGYVVAGFNSGQMAILTQGRYKTDEQVISATFREVNGIPQYLAVTGAV